MIPGLHRPRARRRWVAGLLAWALLFTALTPVFASLVAGDDRYEVVCTAAGLRTIDRGAPASDDGSVAQSYPSCALCQLAHATLLPAPPADGLVPIPGAAVAPSTDVGDTVGRLLRLTPPARAPPVRA